MAAVGGFGATVGATTVPPSTNWTPSVKRILRTPPDGAFEPSKLMCQVWMAPSTWSGFRPTYTGYAVPFTSWKTSAFNGTLLSALKEFVPMDDISMMSSWVSKHSSSMTSGQAENRRSNASMLPAADGNESCPLTVSCLSVVPSGAALQILPSG